MSKIDKTELIQKLTMGAFSANPEQLQAAVQALETKQSKRRLGTARQAAEILETCPTTVKRYRQRGLLEGIKIGQRRLRFDLDAVQRLADYGETGAQM